MTGDTDPVEHCTVAEPLDLPATLEQRAIEYLDVDDQRLIAIFQQAILMVIVSEGDVTAAQEFDVELWEEPPKHRNQEPTQLLTAFIEELLGTAERSLR